MTKAGISMLDAIIEKMLSFKDRLALGLMILPLNTLGYHKYLDKIFEYLHDSKSWRVRILLAEAYLLLNKKDQFDQLISELLELFTNDPSKNYWSLSFIIPYLISRNDEKAFTIFNELMKLFNEKIENKSLDVIDLNDFFEVFFRYSLLFRVDISKILQPIQEMYMKIDSFADFLDILSIYFRHSVFISPPRTTIEKIYEDIFKSLDKRDYLNVRFFSAFLLALSTVNTSKALEEYSAIKKNFPILVNPLSLYSSIKNLRARAGLLYALTSKEFSSEFFSEVDEIMYELADFAKHLRWKYNSWRRGEQVSADDIEEFVSEFKDIAEEEQLGEKELSEDLSYYFDVIINYLADSIEALVTNVLNLCLSSGEKAPDEIISKLIKLIDSVPMFDPSFKATIFSDLAIIEALTSLDPHLLEIAIRNTKAFCRRENKFYCDDLIELVGNRIGRIYYVTRDKAVLDFVLTLIEREDFFKNNRDLLRGFASGLYGLITLIDYSEKYCTMSSCH